LRLPAARHQVEPGFMRDLEAAVDAMERMPWTTLNTLKGNTDVLKGIEKAQTLLASLRKNLSS
jgi:ParB family chromosome partitioning protein